MAEMKTSNRSPFALNHNERVAAILQRCTPIVQPGLSKANAPPEHLAIIGGTNGFIQCITDEPLTVYAGE